MGRYVPPTFRQTIVRMGVWEGMQRVRMRAGQQGDCYWQVGCCREEVHQLNQKQGHCRGVRLGSRLFVAEDLVGRAGI